MTTTTDTGAAAIASLRDAFAVWVQEGIPDDDVPRVFAAALHAYGAASSDYTHTDTARPPTRDIERSAADRSAEQAGARRSQSRAQAEACRAEADAKRHEEKLRKLRARICAIIRKKGVPMSEADIARRLGDAQKLIAAEAIAQLESQQVLFVDSLNGQRHPMYWFGPTGQG